MAATGPFYDLTDAQWEVVRDTHGRFCETQDLGRPLLGAFHPPYFDEPPEAGVPEDDIVLAGPRQRDATMDGHIRWRIREARLLSVAPDRRDVFPTLFIHRDFYGHSQRLAEPFGTTTVIEGNNQAQARPCIASLSDAWTLKPLRSEDCEYLPRSLEVLRYFHESTEGRYYIPHFVTTGPCDTVNYATGSTAFLEGLYTNPKAIHHLLRMATDIIIDHILQCQAIAGDRLISDHTYLLDDCYCICSEIRSQFSGEHYEEFEAPYLKEIGEAVGPLHVHVSGPVEQSLPGTLKDENIKHLRIWLRDCNLQEVADQLGDRVSLNFLRNDCMPALAFESVAAFYRHIFESIRPETRWVIPHYEPEAFNEAYDQLDGEGRLPDQIRRFGRFPVPA